MAFVLDASIVAALAFPDEENELAIAVGQRLLEEDALVPPIWPFEVSNAIVNAVRQKRLTWDETGPIAESLKLLASGIVIAAPTIDEALGGTLDLAHQHRLTAYDASYVYLARRERLPLATLDLRLRRAAVAAGVEVIE
jgi:predicted nucleic acid-binding protein